MEINRLAFYLDTLYPKSKGCVLFQRVQILSEFYLSFTPMSEFLDNLQ